jgi:hypothetical protein
VLLEEAEKLLFTKGNGAELTGTLPSPAQGNGRAADAPD